MYECTFTKERYHQQREMTDWCFDNLGDGGWLADPDALWAVESAFGRTTFRFKRDGDYTIFLLRWS